jgi:putative transposase
LVNKKGLNKQRDNYLICPIDSTTITLKSKLLWAQGYHQVKLFSSLNLWQELPEESLINFGYDHDYKYGKEMIDALLENGVGVMDRGFAGLEYIKQVSQGQKYFVLRISNSWKLKFDDDTGLIRVGTGEKAGVYRVINFCDLETKTEYRIA